MSHTERQSIRASLRHKRKLVRKESQHHAALAIAHNLSNLPIFIHSHSVAAYTQHDGELNPASIIDLTWSLNKQCYLPIIAPGHDKFLQFVQHTSHDHLRPNRLGILEPKAHQHFLLPEKIDLVLVPLVGFTADGHRLGMGGGYYDHTFGFKLDNPEQKPFLLGVAYEMQKVDHLPPKHWDVPLDAVLTEKRIYQSH